TKAVTVQVVPLPLTPVIMPPESGKPNTRVKSPASTPVTSSENTIVHDTVAPLGTSVEPDGVIDTTVGTEASTVYTSPVALPLPAPAPPGGLSNESRMVSSPTRFSPSVPAPLPVFAVTV